jgi:hypothetical protein
MQLKSILQMNKIVIIGITFLFSLPIFEQISEKVLTVQVVAYRSKLEKIKIKSKDTISKELIKYEVDITVIDSTKE